MLVDQPAVGDGEHPRPELLLGSPEPPDRPGDLGEDLGSGVLGLADTLRPHVPGHRSGQVAHNSVHAHSRAHAGGVEDFRKMLTNRHARHRGVTDPPHAM
jgi:hypothetical protein